MPGEAARLIFMDWLNFEELLLEQQQEKTSPLSEQSTLAAAASAVIEAVPSFTTMDTFL